MRTLIPTLTLVTTLALTTLCEAGPRKPAPAPAVSTLTPIEGLCHEVGNTAKKNAKMRDAGLSYLEAAQLMRQFIANNPIPGEWGVWLYTSILGNLRWVYDNPSTSAQQIRTETELACLRIAEHNGLSGTTVVKDRY